MTNIIMEEKTVISEIASKRIESMFANRVEY